MKADKLVSEITAYCTAHADPKKAASWKRYFTEGFDAWGVLDKNDPLWIAKKQEWLERYAALGLAGFLELGERLFACGKYEAGALAIHFAAHYRDSFDAAAFARLGRWFEAGIGNWAHTDVLCGLVIAPLVDSGRVGLDALAGWRESRFKYQRRAVPVGMLELIKSGKDVRPLLDFIRPLMLDGERVVQQGLGWFLREAWKKDPKPVEKFLLEWKDQAPRLIFQYATEKMTPAARTRFRRAKAAGK